MGKRWDRGDKLLLALIVGLSSYLLAQLWEGGWQWWRSWPRPGAQVDQHYVGRAARDSQAVETAVDYLLYLPPAYTPTSRWPLLMFLHGSGECGADLDKVRHAGLAQRIEEGQHPEAIVVSPQCPARSDWQPQTLVALLEHLATTLPVDRDRVYLTGFSQGGYGTWATACYDPARFAAIAPVAGGGDVRQAKRLAKLAIWAFHGAKDTVVPLKASAEMVEAVREEGGQVAFTVYPDCGHGACSDCTYRDPRVLAWLLAQRRGDAADTAASGVGVK